MTSAAHQPADAIANAFSDLKTPADQALMARVTRFFHDAIAGLPNSDKALALQADDDILTVIETLARSPARQSAKLQAKLRGAVVKRRLLEDEGGVVRPSEAAKLLGVTRQTIRLWRTSGKLLGIPLAGGYVYPQWQIQADGQMLSGIKETLANLQPHDVWMQLRFFLNESLALDGERPLDALRAERVPEVLRAARLYGQQAAV